MFREVHVFSAQFFALGGSGKHSLLSALFHQNYDPVAGSVSQDISSCSQKTAEGTSMFFCGDGYFYKQTNGVAV